MDNRRLADQYFSIVNSGDLDALCALYTKDAVVGIPNGTELHGVAAIRTMYSGLFADNAPAPKPINVITGPDSIAAQLEIRLPSGEVRHTANFFQLNKDGLITRMTVYLRQA